MSNEEQIARALGEIMGKLDVLQIQFQRYVDAHDDRHTLIDADIKEHSAQINQAKGAKGAILAFAGFIGGAVAFAIKKLFP